MHAHTDTGVQVEGEKSEWGGINVHALVWYCVILQGGNEGNWMKSTQVISAFFFTTPDERDRQLNKCVFHLPHHICLKDRDFFQTSIFMEYLDPFTRWGKIYFPMKHSNLHYWTSVVQRNPKLQFIFLDLNPPSSTAERYQLCIWESALL